MGFHYFNTEALPLGELVQGIDVEVNEESII